MRGFIYLQYCHRNNESHALNHIALSFLAYKSQALVAGATLLEAFYPVLSTLQLAHCIRFLRLVYRTRLIVNWYRAMYKSSQACKHGVSYDISYLCLGKGPIGFK